jgi:hypothetical protein
MHTELFKIKGAKQGVLSITILTWSYFCTCPLRESKKTKEVIEWRC